MAKYGPKPANRRWGKLSEYNQRIRVGSPSWQAMPYRLKQLSAWRFDHVPAVAKGHLPVRRYARKYGVGKSSDITLGSKVTFALSRLGRKRK